MKNGTNFWRIVEIALLLLIIFLLYKNLTKDPCKDRETIKSLQTQVDDLTAKNKALSDENAKLKEQIGVLNRALADCQGEKPASKTLKKPASRTLKPNTEETKPEVKKTKDSETLPGAAIKVEDFSKEKSSLLQPDENKDDNIFYEPVITGDVGNTLYDWGYILFYISDRLFQTYATIPAPLFNTRMGIPFVKEGNYWVFRSRIKGKLGGYFNWCVYVGQNQEYGFYMFLPHEWQKRGGADVKALIKAGMVRPNGIADADQVTEGWEHYFPLTGTATAVSKDAGNVAP